MEKGSALSAAAVSPTNWEFLKMGVPAFEIPAFKSATERESFDAEVEDAEVQGFSVEYMILGEQIIVIMELMGEKVGKAGAKKGMDRALDGGNIDTLTEVILRAQGSTGQSGQLIPDICCFPAGFNYDFRGSTPPHPPIVVEIDWIEHANDALNKRNLYFAPAFVAPDGSRVNEVWFVFLARTATTVPVLTVPALTNTHPFVDVPTILNAATAVGAEEPTIIVFHHRDSAYPPSYGVLDWNTSLAAPVGSLFTGRLDSNEILHRAYRGTISS